MAMDLRPVNVVAGQGFQELMEAAAPGYQLPHRTTISRTYIPEMYSEVHGKVVKKYEPAQHVAFTTDNWTNFKSDSYNTVTAHFIDDAWELINAVLTTRLVEGSCTGEVLRDMFISSSKEHKLQRKSKTLVTDQGANIIKAAKLEELHHLFCVVHKTNLC